MKIRLRGYVEFQPVMLDEVVEVTDTTGRKLLAAADKKDWETWDKIMTRILKSRASLDHPEIENIDDVTAQKLEESDE